MTERRVKLCSPYGRMIAYDGSCINNGRCGTLLAPGRVRFDGRCDSVEVPTHWVRQIDAALGEGAAKERK